MRRRQAGYALIVVIFVLAASTVALTLLQRQSLLVRQQAFAAHRARIAVAMAESGVELAIARLEATGPTAVPLLAEPFEVFATDRARGSFRVTLVPATGAPEQRYLVCSTGRWQGQSGRMTPAGRVASDAVERSVTAEVAAVGARWRIRSWRPGHAGCPVPVARPPAPKAHGEARGSAMP